MSSTRTHPRRSARSTLDTSCGSPLLSVNPKAASEATSLQKGASFHASRLPSTNVTDPIINVRGLPLRSPTSPDALEELVKSTEKLMSEYLPSKVNAPGTKGLTQAESLPVPAFLVAHASLPDIPKKNTKYGNGFTPLSATAQNIHSHDSDSGLGSSVSSVTSHDPRSTADRLRLTARNRTSVYSPTRAAGEPSISPSDDEGQSLSDQATKQIQDRIITPLLNDEQYKGYHKLVGRLPSFIAEKKIVCLRDLEKSLVFLAPSEAKSAASYFKFCLTSIDLIVHTVHHLNDRDLRQPSDRPYTNNYFVDLIEQVRQYAGIMAASRKKQSEGKPLDKEDYTSDERLRLTGGMSVDGRPARLVREKGDQNLAIDAEPMELADDVDEDPERSMARKRKCDIGKEVWHACRECGKQFKRPCDLTKHEKTHSRPFKCPKEDCKYHILGWPTDKECERHFNDKHTDSPAVYHCLYEDCSYTSKRESNCKQHMEKTHGYSYVRSKSKKAERLVATAPGQTPDQSALLTPSSAFQSISTPASMTSPQMGTLSNELSPPATDEGASPYTSNAPALSLFDNNTALMGGNFDGNFNFGDLPPSSHEMTPQTSNALGTPGSGSLFSETEAMLPAEDAWNMRFDFGELAMEEGFPSPEEFFGQYAQPTQQITPAMSDFDLSKDMMPENDKMTATAMQQNPMFNQQADSLPSSALHAGDFSLFGEQGESSNMANMFADLNGNNQFQQSQDNNPLDFPDMENF